MFVGVNGVVLCNKRFVNITMIHISQHCFVRSNKYHPPHERSGNEQIATEKIRTTPEEIGGVVNLLLMIHFGVVRCPAFKPMKKKHQEEC
jgi:hypothetical protein